MGRARAKKNKARGKHAKLTKQPKEYAGTANKIAMEAMYSKGKNDDHMGSSKAGQRVLQISHNWQKHTATAAQVTTTIAATFMTVGIVYIMFNAGVDQVYVGQTRGVVNDRIAQHVQQANKVAYMREHGLEAVWQHYDRDT